MDGYDLNLGSPPPPPDTCANDDYSSFSSHTEFELMELLYVHAEMSAGRIDKLMNLLATLNQGQPPFASHQELYSLIDAIKEGDIAWNSFSIAYNGAIPQDGQPTPPWMMDLHEIWFQDPLQVIEAQIGNPEFKNMIDISPKQVYHKGKCQYEDLMSGNWAWDQVVCSYTSCKQGAE